MGSTRGGGVVFVGGKRLNQEERKEVTVTEFPDNEVALDVMIKGAAGSVPVSATEADPVNSKELKQLVSEDVPVANIEYPLLSMAISTPVDDTHFDPGDPFNLTYVSIGGMLPRTCGVRISTAPITNDVEFNAAPVLLIDGSPDNGVAPVNAPMIPDTYYIRGRVTDTQPVTALSNQVVITVD